MVLEIERRTYTPAEAAALLGCTRHHLYGLLDAGKVPSAFRLGGRWVIGREPFDRWLNGESA